MKLNGKQLTQILVNALKGKKDQDSKDIIVEFLRFLSERGELHRIREIERNIDSVWKENYGVANIEVETAHPLSSELKNKLLELAKGASIEEKVNPELIGGARFRIDDRLIDGSVAGNLAALRNSLK